MPIKLSKFKNVINNLKFYNCHHIMKELKSNHNIPFNLDGINITVEYSKEFIDSFIKREEENSVKTGFDNLSDNVLMTILTKEYLKLVSATTSVDEYTSSMFFPIEWKVGYVFFNKVLDHYCIILKIYKEKGVFTKMLISQLTSQSGKYTCILKSNFKCNKETYLYANVQIIDYMPEKQSFRFYVSPNTKEYKAMKSWLQLQLNF